jgi:hypothetical protein
MPALSLAAALAALSPPAAAGFGVQAASFSVGGTWGMDRVARCDWGCDATWGATLPSPMAALDLEVGFPHLRGEIGLFSAPLALHHVASDVVCAPVALGLVGLFAGSDTLRGGLFAAAGYVDGQVGLRAVYAPFATRRGMRHGFDLRVAMAPTTTVLWSLGWTLDLVRPRRSDPGT